MRRIHLWATWGRRKFGGGSLCGERDGRAKHLIAQGCRQGAQAPFCRDFPILQNYRTSTTLYPANTIAGYFGQPDRERLHLHSGAHQHQHQAPLYLPSLPCLIHAWPLLGLPGHPWAPPCSHIGPSRLFLIHGAQPRCHLTRQIVSALVGSASATYYRFGGLDVSDALATGPR